MQTKQEIIIRKFRDGENNSKIAKDVGVCRRTVRNYTEAYSMEKAKLLDCPASNRRFIEEIVKPPTYDSSNRKKKKITAEIISAVSSCLEENRKKRSRGQHKQILKRVDIFEHVKSLGHDIGYTSISLLANELEEKHHEAYIRQSYAPGNICEFDWAAAKIFIAGKLKSLRLAVFTSAYGNYRYSVLFPKENTQALQEAHARFFDHIDGVYRTLVYDNMKVAVRKFVGRFEKEATKGLLELSTYYNFSFRFCNVRAGNEKGHVEKSVSYVRQKAFSRRDHFQSLEEANEYLLEVCDELNRKPQRNNKNLTACELFETEKDYLLPNAVSPFESGRLEELRVDKYSTIMVDRCHYSVPDQYVKEMITAKIYSNEIHCFFGGRPICIHNKSLELDDWIIDIDHYLKTLSRKPGAFTNSVAMMQMKQEYKLLYRKHFSENPKDFLELLLYLKEKQIGMDEIMPVIHSLEKSCPKSITTDTIKAVKERNIMPQMVTIDNNFDRFAVDQLMALSELIPLKESLNECREVL